jgi:hypothetical protein
MTDEVVRTVGNVRLVAYSLRVENEPDEDSDYIVNASVIDGHNSAAPIRLTKPGSAEAALDQAARHPWVVEHSGLSGTA